MAIPYFSFLSATLYRNKATPNFAARISVANALDNKNLLFHKYQIEDGDRPDTIAFFYYGSSFYDWIVMLSNGIYDITTQWPLTAKQFERFIEDKYGSFVNALETVVSYRLKTNISPIDNTTFNALGDNQKKYWTSISSQSGSILYSLDDTGLTISEQSYTNLPNDERIYWEPYTAYDYEMDLNESKRAIRLLDAQYLTEIEKALKVASNV